MDTILHSSEFNAALNGHGGNRRTAQLVELVFASCFEIETVSKTLTTTRLDRYLYGAHFLARHRVTIPHSYQMIGGYGHQAQIYKKSLKSHSGIKLLLWEDTYNYLVPLIAKELGFKLVAAPQNLESMVTGNVNILTGKSLPENFEDEINCLSKTEAVFCISREEQWLLRLRDINADFLPYYPPQSILSNLLNIRESRGNLQNKRFLVVGTANNPPTRVGMVEQIQWLKQVGKEIEIEVDIAGYGTEQLKEYCDRPNFTLHGTVAPDELDALMKNAKAVLLHQRAGVGALTRIPEMLIAGIPVIANGNACRSAFNYPGVYCYDSQAELAELLSKPLDTPAVLPRPTAAEKRFIDCLKQLAQ